MEQIITFYCPECKGRTECGVTDARCGGCGEFFNPRNVESEEPEPKEAFHIDSEAAANWYLRKLANIESEKARVQAQAAQIVKQLEADTEGLRHLYEAELQEFVRAQLERSGNRRKSLTLLQGTCAFRTVPGGLRLVDMATAEVFALGEGLDVFVSRFNPSAYRAIAEATGEVLPGMEVAEDRESFSVRFGKGE